MEEIPGKSHIGCPNKPLAVQRLVPTLSHHIRPQAPWGNCQIETLAMGEEDLKQAFPFFL